jgi:hypothetical protein
LHCSGGCLYERYGYRDDALFTVRNPQIRLNSLVCIRLFALLSLFTTGMGGYNGRCNWFHDRNEKGGTTLYKALPPELICPWLTTAAEIRCYDVEAKSLDEMKEYMNTYQGADQRFIDPKCTFSHAARLTFRSKSNIAQYLLSYISRDYSYSELKRNCQTLAADLCSFVAGKKDVAPYHPINRIEYHNRTHLFLYDSDMFDKNKKSSKTKHAK